MRIAITGASGNVGTALLLQLGASGEHELVGISRRLPPTSPPYEWARWHQADIGAPDATTALQTAFEGADAVVHLAWALQPSRDREQLKRINQDGTAAVAEAARRARVPHVVHMSSIGAYAPAAGRSVDEHWPATGVPTSIYSVDKVAAERVISSFDGRFAITTLRPALILQDAAASEISRYFLGPLVPTRALGTRLMRFAPLPAHLSIQVVHADDVARAIELVLTRRAEGSFNIAAEPPVDRATFAATFGGVGPALAPSVLRAVAAASYHLRLQPTEPGWLDLALNVPHLDTGRIRALGWQPQHGAEEVVGRFVAAIARHAGRPGPLLYRRTGA